MKYIYLGGGRCIRTRTLSLPPSSGPSAPDEDLPPLKQHPLFALSAWKRNTHAYNMLHGQLVAVEKAPKKVSDYLFMLKQERTVRKFWSETKDFEYFVT
jgi:hypothetical protein